jgi:hypothetical protein
LDLPDDLVRIDRLLAEEIEVLGAAVSEVESQACASGEIKTLKSGPKVEFLKNALNLWAERFLVPPVFLALHGERPPLFGGER